MKWQSSQVPARVPSDQSLQAGDYVGGWGEAASGPQATPPYAQNMGGGVAHGYFDR
jgi:hypothetical protein